ncbi:MAG: isoaspartyl peptidase/L-asparaginase [Calditrichaeota bacterium]|nr:isoaspartyl peptidase/L-asparaginase [Calditrichota bacterium]MCB9087258.1 isoaspartyl peptidase/L-asparaginase [Calditrichia bacterium]
MKKMSMFVGIGLALLMSVACEEPEAKPEAATGAPAFGIVLHGGAGTILKENMTAETETAYREKLSEALQVGYDILKNGGSSLDAVEQTIHILEDSPLFNSGKGAVYTHDGTHELDASIMDGRTRNAGAVAGVQRVKHPISLARQVLEHSPHVMLSGAGAEAFAAQQGLEMVDPAYFDTERRYQQLQKALEKEAAEGTSSALRPAADHKFGTVGVAALDQQGNLAAGTSTGGMTNKRFGRIGDSPVIGAGTYADNRTCAVSSTGHGEYFIRSVVAYDISALMAYKGMTLQQAADEVVMKKLVEFGGEGGIIAIDKNGNIAMPFNTPGMYRGYMDKDGRAVVKIYRE